MVDFHAHILPAIDDGCKSLEQSVSVLQSMADEKLDIVIATPHFYCNKTTIDEFLEARAASFSCLKNEILGKDYPQIKLGAEVMLTTDLLESEGIERLCIEGTNLMLIEMPYTYWSDNYFYYIDSLYAEYNIIPVIAHIDRYFDIASQSKLDILVNMEVYVQANADAFLFSKATAYRAYKMLKNDTISVIGSDCHNTTSRPFNLHKAYEAIRKKFGIEMIDKIDSVAAEMLDLI